MDHQSRDIGRRVPALDGVRGFFTLLVNGAHSILFGGLGDAFWSGRSLSMLSHFDQISARCLFVGHTLAAPGMDLFFVLSSFLITGILCDSKGLPGYFVNFYARRTLRIFPLYYLSLTTLLLVTFFFHPNDPIFERKMWFFTYLQNFLFARGWEQTPRQFHHLWSLAVEEQFYLVWPTLLFLFDRRAIKMICAATVLLAPTYRVLAYAAGDGDAVYVTTFGRLDQLALGALLAIAAREAGGLARWAGRMPPVLVTTLATITAMGLWRGGLVEPDPIVGTIGHSLYALFAAALICYLVTSRSWIERFFEQRWLRAIGRYSYGLYLFNQPLVLFLSGRLGINLWHMPRFTGFVLVGQLGHMLLLITLSLAAATLSWHFLEKPSLRFKERFPTARKTLPHTMKSQNA